MLYTQEMVGFSLMFYEYSYFVLILDKLFEFDVCGRTTWIDVAGQVLMRFTSAIMIKSGGGAEYDDQRLWQMLVSESFQAGLSWIAILRRRERFFKVFQGLDPNIIANWGDVEVADLV